MTRRGVRLAATAAVTIALLLQAIGPANADPSGDAKATATSPHDELTYAVASDSLLARDLSLASVRRLYRCEVPGVTAYLPPRGAEQRTRWLALMDLTEDDVARPRSACVTDRFGGAPVDEDDARGLLGDASAVMPFSVASYLAQLHGTRADVRGGAVLGRFSDLTSSVVEPDRASHPSDVTYAVARDGVVPADLTRTQLRALYTCAAGTGRIDVLLPPPGSPVRTAWLAFLGIDDAAVVAGRHPCVRTVTNGQFVQEDDGRVLGRQSIVPFSISGWATQSNGQASDLRGRARLAPLRDEVSAPGLPLRASVRDDDPIARLGLAFAPRADEVLPLSPLPPGSEPTAAAAGPTSTVPDPTGAPLAGGPVSDVPGAPTDADCTDDDATPTAAPTELLPPVPLPVPFAVPVPVPLAATVDARWVAS